MSVMTLNGSPYHTIGSLPAVGSAAPDFTVTKTDLGEVHLKHYAGKKVVLNIFPSLDTPTCAAAMHEFNQLADGHKNILFLCISADLPFAQKRFCVAEHLDNVLPASTFRHPQFAKDYGVLIVDGPLTGLLTRAAVVIDEKGKVTYTQVANEVTKELNYDELKKAF